MDNTFEEDLRIRVPRRWKEAFQKLASSGSRKESELAREAFRRFLQAEVPANLHVAFGLVNYSSDHLLQAAVEGALAEVKDAPGRPATPVSPPTAPAQYPTVPRKPRKKHPKK